MNGHVELWAWDGTLWRKVLIDAAGHLQIDVVSAPIGQANIYGYDGAAWQRGLLEGIGLHNLRVKLFDGANGIDSDALDGDLTTEQALLTKGVVLGKTGANYFVPVYARTMNSDNENIWASGLVTSAVLYGFNGAALDRLRTYGTGVLKIGRAEIDSTTTRLVAAGQVKASAGALYWLTCNPDAGNSVFELSDDLDGLGAVVLDCFSTTREGKGFNFDPPMKFATGIRLKTFTNMTSMTFCYV